ncbi:MAG: hypothetical protein ACOCU4_02140 [Alkalispirochaeta sp.]
MEGTPRRVLLLVEDDAIIALSEQRTLEQPSRSGEQDARRIVE